MTEILLPIMGDKISVDSNIILYFLDEFDPQKQLISSEILSKKPIFSSQVLSEVINVLQKSEKYSKQRTAETVSFLFNKCEYIVQSQQDIEKGFALMKRYQFQLFDSIIVASALEAGCDTLYTEDMQHGLVVEKKLKIINPFL